MQFDEQICVLFDALGVSRSTVTNLIIFGFTVTIYMLILYVAF